MLLLIMILSAAPPNAQVRQRVRQAPPFVGRRVVLHVDVCISRCDAHEPEGANHLTDERLVDKVVESKSIGVLEFEFVVVGQDAEQDKGFVDMRGLLDVLNIL